MSSNCFCHIFTCNQVKTTRFQQFRCYLSKLSRKGEITITVEYFSSIFFKENKNVHIQFDIEHLFTFVMREKKQAVLSGVGRVFSNENFIPSWHLFDIQEYFLEKLRCAFSLHWSCDKYESSLNAGTSCLMPICLITEL